MIDHKFKKNRGVYKCQTFGTLQLMFTFVLSCVVPKFNFIYLSKGDRKRKKVVKLRAGRE